MKFVIFLLKSLFYQTAFLKVRRKGVLIYLKTLQMIRKSIALSLVVFFALQMMVLGFVGAVVSGIWLLPIEDNTTRLWILFSVSGVFFLAPLLLLIVLLSERTWFKASGAEQLLPEEISKKAA